MKTRHIAIFLLVLTALVLQACAPGDAQDAVNTAVAQTLQISALETAAAGGQPAQPTSGGQPVDTAAPSNTPTITLTPTPSIPYVTVSQATNCRSGPSIQYSLITTVQVGQQAEVVNLFNNDYVVVRNPNGSGVCWLFLDFANTHDFTAYNLPYATQPPTPFPTATPTPEWDWNGSWSMTFGGLTGSGTWTRSGNSISGTFSDGANDYTFSGSLSSGGQVASGTVTYVNVGTNGTFEIMIKSGNHNQFIGTGTFSGTDYQLCGWRSGSSAPSPCQWP